MQNQYTLREYAKEVCYGKVTPQTVGNWVKRWEAEGNLPDDHRIERMPSGRPIIIVDRTPKPKPMTKVDQLVAMLEQGM